MGTRRGRDGRLTPTAQREIDRFTENWERRPNPISLPLPLVESTGTVHECEPAPVRVLMPMMVSYTMSEEMPARVVAWTNRAVKVQATLPDGRQVDAWVWANAVRRVDDQADEA